MNPNKALWEKGDFTRLAQSMRRSGELLVNGLGITKGLKIMDVGCGDGTTALPEAMLGAEVLGVDIASNLVAAGNTRASEDIPKRFYLTPRCVVWDSDEVYASLDARKQLAQKTKIGRAPAPNLQLHRRRPLKSWL